jgi:tetratricopeptide (TPR) repeat protein
MVHRAHPAGSAGVRRRALLPALLVFCLHGVAMLLPRAAHPAPARPQSGAQAQEMDRLLAEGKAALAKGDLAAAERLARVGLEKAEEAKDTRRTATFLTALGSVCLLQGQFDRALDCFQKALQLQETLGNSRDIAASLGNLGNVHYFLGQFDRALENYRKALQLQEKLGNSRDIAASLGNLGNVHYSLGQFDRALENYRKALQLQETLGNPQEIATTLNNLGSAYTALGQNDQALENYRKALQLRETLGNPQEIATTLNNLGNVHYSLGQNDQAQDYFEKALQLQAKIGNPQKMATTLNNLGNVCCALGQNDQALEYHQQALQLREKVGNPQDIATSLNNLGSVYNALNQFDRALDCFQKALQLRETLGNPQDIATSLDNLGSVYYSLGQFDRALDCFQKALQLREKVGNPQDIATSLDNLGRVHYFLGQFDRALDCFQKAYQLQEKVGNPREIAVCLNNLGSVHTALGQFDKVLDYFQKAYQLQEKVGNPREIAVCLNNLGNVHYFLGQNDQAQDYFEKALQLQAKIGNPRDMATTLDNLGNVCSALGRPEKAFESLRRSLLLQQSITDQVFAFSAEPQMRQILASLPSTLDSLLTLATVPDAPANATTVALTWILRRKAAALDAAARFHQCEDALRTDPELREEYRRLLRLRALAASSQRAETDRQQSAKQAEALEQRLKLAFSKRNPAPEDRDLPAYNQDTTALTLADEALLSTVRSRMPPDAALVEFVRYRPINFIARRREAWVLPLRYLAFVLRKDLPQPALVDLGEADRLDSPTTGAIGQARDPLQRLADARQWPQDLLRASENRFRKAALRLRQLVFDPLLPHLQGVRRLYLAPDGALSLFPFEALPEGENGYLIQRYHVSYLTSGRDLLRSPGSVTPGASQAFVAPDFDRLPAQTAGQTAAGPGYPPQATDPKRRGAAAGAVAAAAPGREALAAQQRPAGRAPERYRVNRALGTSSPAFLPLADLLGRPPTGQRRLDAYADHLRSLTGAFVVLGIQATEERFEAVKSPRILHALTHGFFVTAPADQMPDTDRLAARRKLVPPAPGQGRALAGGLAQERFAGALDPMLRSGIVLAGANRWKEARMRGVADGWVTAAEMTLMDLRGTELVVLAACETGLGDPSSGEGVFGVRRALLLAGAKSVLGSLFKVPPAQTLTLTERFYANLGAGLDREESLREAQLGFLRNPATRHPFFWASFVLTGDTAPLPVK